ncbi:winged helix-turn-helix transcriptional regulator [Lachnospiraceae bacterium ZAX-1]
MKNFSICFRTRSNNQTCQTLNHENNFGLNFGLNETQTKIVNLMIEKPEITAGQIAENIGITKRQVESNISKLKAFGLIE